MTEIIIVDSLTSFRKDLRRNCKYIFKHDRQQMKTNIFLLDLSST